MFDHTTQNFAGEYGLTLPEISLIEVMLDETEETNRPLAYTLIKKVVIGIADRLGWTPRKVIDTVGLSDIAQTVLDMPDMGDETIDEYVANALEVMRG